MGPLKDPPLSRRHLQRFYRESELLFHLGTLTLSRPQSAESSQKLYCVCLPWESECRCPWTTRGQDDTGGV